ncbi:MAG: macro domain-containing protein [Verrucomicrobia bacterium]|nr:macro domain-containing protein [Verrucomicrobiota bacterium]
MIQYLTGDLLSAEVEALVNTVNCVGVMGKGIALQFRQAWPDDYFKDYQRACKEGDIAPGKVQVWDAGRLVNPRYIVNFPTKRHWKGRSRIEDISTGLASLKAEIQNHGIRSIAIPPLGCGNGGLEWSVVRRLIDEHLSGLEDVDVQVFEPAGAPSNEAMKVRTKRPKMTRGRAALLHLFGSYLQPGYKLTMLESQKLAYFLQAAGEPLRLNFAKQQYGPYAENLHHVLQRIEGHFIRGYGDRSRDASLQLLPTATEEATGILETEFPEALKFASRVEKLITGFETPFGLELISSVHWVAAEDSACAESPVGAISAIHDWNERKGQVFDAHAIGVAWEKLKDAGWLELQAVVK